MRERVWFTSDSHFGHARIIALCRRPFSDVREMDEAMIRAWNERIEPSDVVHHIGDFGQGDRMRMIFSRLNGEKHLVKGNHDDESTLELDWASISSERELIVDHQRIFAKHYPMRTWPGIGKSGIHVFGHMHGKLRGYSNSLDVGVDCWGFKPVSLQEIQRRLKTLPPDPDFSRGEIEIEGAESAPRM